MKQRKKVVRADTVAERTNPDKEDAVDGGTTASRVEGMVAPTGGGGPPMIPLSQLGNTTFLIGIGGSPNCGSILVP